MKLLRQIIRKIILQESVKETFKELWYNVEEERSKFQGDPYFAGSHHKDNLKQMYPDDVHGEIEELFDNKRDLKRLWNEQVDTYGLRSFWEGPKMKYFHSLSYYGSPMEASDKLSYSDDTDEAIHDLSARGFFKLYRKDNNRDEMSTYGIYNGMHQIPRQQQKFGVIISGRVTLASMKDSFTESRSKATKKDIARHAGSGMPKRIMPSDEMIDDLLFEEDDIIESGLIGECVLDNWGIDAIVCTRNWRNSPSHGSFYKAAERLAKQYAVPLLDLEDLGKEIS